MASYEDFASAARKRDGKSALCQYLRKGWSNNGPNPPGPVYGVDGYDENSTYVRAHYLDVELAAEAVIRMRGPFPSREYFVYLRDALRDQSNWRWLRQSRNKKEIRWVDMILDGRKIKVDGHFRSKVSMQVEWLHCHKYQLSEGFVAALADILDVVRDEDGHKVLDRRSL